MTKKVIKYVFVFICSLVFLNFIPFDLDEIWNYGFMHSMYSGLVPYRDFNMVVTPFFPLLFSLPFHLFGSNLLVVNVCQSLLIVLTYVLLEKLIGDKANILLLLMFFNYDMMYASYNYFIFFLFLSLLYLEKNKSNDYVIGIVIGLAVLTKQSVGGLLAIVSLYYVFKEKDFKKLVKRVIGAMLPVGLFLIYLAVTGAFADFVNLCILGLFDFGTNNYVGVRALVLGYILLIGVVIYFIVKRRNSIDKYYVLAFSTIAIPMFDYFHIKFFVLALLILVLEKINIKKINLNLLLYGSMIGIVFINLIVSVDGDMVYPNSIKHFEYRYISSKHIKETQLVSGKLKDYSDKELLLLFEQSYYYKISNDFPINHFDLINTGNWGYKGSEKLLKELKKKKDAVFVINRLSYEGTRQTDKTALNYVLKNCKKIDEIYGFEFYIRK